jgi:cell division transport system permease protein
MASTPRAATANIKKGVRLVSWARHNTDCIRISLQRIFSTPMSSLLTISVLAISLALPGGLYMLTNNLLSLSGSWDIDAQITLYLREDIDNEQGSGFADTLKQDTRFVNVHYMSKVQALEEFKSLSGFADALSAMDENPLPAVINLLPSAAHSSPESLEKIQQEFANHPRVELSQLDLQWVKRLHAIVEMVQHGLLIVFALLALAVIFIVGNTIRLEIENRRDEIIITKLFGATHAFIRRPFLYDGFWFGFFGGIVACILILAGLWLIGGPAKDLLTLYDSQFQIQYPNTLFVLMMLFFGGFLGYLGAWSAVSQHLYKIEPS